MKLLFLIFINLLIFNFTLFSQEADSINNNCSFNSYFKNKPIDAHLLIFSPLKWNKKDIIAFAGLMSLEAIAFHKDEKIANVFIKNKNKFTDNSTKYIFQPLGNGYIVGPSVLLALGIGSISKYNKLTFFSLTASKSLFYSGFITMAVKYAAHRHRPYESGLNSNIWDGPSLSSEHHSYLSGHSSTAFSVATSIASVYHDKTLLKWSAYTIATGVALSRVYDNKHWASDVIAGAALGYAVSRFCYNNDKRRSNFSNITLLPQNNGLLMVYRF